jgi:hypothetical protein
MYYLWKNSKERKKDEYTHKEKTLEIGIKLIGGFHEKNTI